MKLSKDTKETLQIIGMAAFGTFVVLYQQGYILSDKDKDQVKTEQVIQHTDSTTVAQRDTATMHVLRNVKQLKR